MQFRDTQDSQSLLSFLLELAALRAFTQTVISQGDVNHVHFACPSIFFVAHLRKPAVNSAKAGRGLTERGQQEWAVSILVGANPKDLTAGIHKPAQMPAGEDLA